MFSIAMPRAFSEPAERVVSSATQMELILVCGGSFSMGSPAGEPERDDNERQHRVALTRPYYLGACEVTQAEYEKVTGYNPSTKRGNPRLPVETVTWFDAVDFCNRLSDLEGRRRAYRMTVKAREGPHITDAAVQLHPRSSGYRLPTEAEWEFACRAGTTTPFSFGETVSAKDANFDGQTPYHGAAKGPFTRQTLPVDALPANPWGFRQMSGNVFEWVGDYYGEYPSQGQTDPMGPGEGVERVRRGGSYYSPGGHMRSAVRHAVPPGAILFHMGFRVARDLETVEGEGK
jgi:formylglycine-generating enzyme required for sulfatase activity